MTTTGAAGDTPVVVVGAGPVGLTVALEFAAHGVATLVLESGALAVSQEWRGSTIHPPTLEILDALGLADDALRGGVRVDTIQYRDLVLDDVVEMHFAVLADRTRFPFRLQYEQYKLLRRLRDAAAENPHVDVWYGHTVVGVEPGDEHTRAAVVVQTPDGTRTRIEVPWVVAADGSHSVVRKALGVAMSGDTYATTSLVVATNTQFEALLPGLAQVSYWTGPRGRMSLIRTPDTWRVALTIRDAPGHIDFDSPSAQPAIHPDFTHAMSLAVGERTWTDLGQHQRYRSHQRVADTFRVGRVLLVGDASHVSATTGGMGLNSGVHDAHELVDALAPAIRTGRGEHAAAAAVAASRRHVAQQCVQPATRMARAAVDVTDEAARRRRLQTLRQVAGDEERLAAHLFAACMLDAVDLRRLRGSAPTRGSVEEQGR